MQSTKQGPSMTALVARTGRHQQRYKTGYRLVAGCIPYRYKHADGCNGKEDPVLEVLMITSKSGRGLLFPKGGWETDETVEEAALREALEEAGVRGFLQEDLGSWEFFSKRQQNDFSPEGRCRAYMFALAVTEQLESWPEQQTRQRQWFPVAEAVKQCQVEWMLGALHKCVSFLSSRQSSASSASPSSTTTAPPSHFSNQGQSFI